MALPEEVATIFRDMRACGYESKYTLADLERAIERAILMARVEGIYRGCHADELCPECAGFSAAIRAQADALKEGD